MRKIITAFALLIIFSVRVEAVAISDSEIEDATEIVAEKLRYWNCTEIKIWYGGDELNSEENIAYMNELALANGFEEKFTACMVLYSDFHSPPDDGDISAWEYDTDYENYSWYFGLYEDGEWKLLTWGY